MNSDGSCTSLWHNTVKDIYPQINGIGNKNFDVLIVGGGITCVTTGLQLKKKGKTCIIVEANNICFGTSGGTTAHLNTFFDTTYDQIQKNYGKVDAQLVARAARQ